MAMVLRTLLFHVDNGMGPGLEGDGYSAEYDLWTGKVTWRQATKETIKKQQSLTFLLWILAAGLTPFTVAGLIMLARTTPIFGATLTYQLDRYAPLIFGVVLFLAFEALMIAIRLRDPIATEEPSKERQHAYFTSMYDFAIRENFTEDALPPYLATYLSSLLVLIVAGVLYFLYLHPTLMAHSLENLFMTSFFISLVPNIIWNLLIKQLVFLKLIRQTKP